MNRIGQDREDRPAFDAKLHRDVVAEAVHGRKIGTYVRALGKAGFRYLPPEHLPPWQDGKGRMEGEWRHERLRLALTDSMVCSWFESPKDFVFWFRTQFFKAQGRGGQAP